MSKAPSHEDALELALRLERVLAALAAEAAPAAHLELRLAQALAGNLADQLETARKRNLGFP